MNKLNIEYISIKDISKNEMKGNFIYLGQNSFNKGEDAYQFYNSYENCFFIEDEKYNKTGKRYNNLSFEFNNYLNIFVNVCAKVKNNP